MNPIELAMGQAAAAIAAAAARATGRGDLPAPVIEAPRDPSHGDWATGFALQNAKALGQNPRQLAQQIIGALALEDTCFASAEVAGPGFINLRLRPRWFSDTLSAILAAGQHYGRTAAEKPEKIMVEFVSANPTGPMHMGNARGGALGDSLAEVLERAGHTVEREFYINDAGNQIEKFAQSLLARYRQLILGEAAVAFPEDGYQGDDIRQLAQSFYDRNGDMLARGEAAVKDALSAYGLGVNIPLMKSDLARYRVGFDTWFSESSLYESGQVAETVERLIQSGHTYEADGALWLKSTDFGCEKDDVLRRSNGFYTYFAADIAYHRNKLETRGFHRSINIWGADHHGHVVRLQKALDAIGLDGSHRLEIVLMQMVRLMQNGQVARMSKRTGKAITLRDLLDEIPADAARFFFNSRQSDTHLEFDMDLAVRQDRENPVYYVQYAHARIHSILRALSQDGIDPSAAGAELGLLAHPAELALIRQLAQLPEEIRQAAAAREPARLNRYAAAVAGAFHKFYDDCPIRQAETPALRDARVALLRATAWVIKNTLSCFGVSAPEAM